MRPSIQVYDSLGTTHLMTTYFTKTSDQSWEYNSVVDSADLSTPGADPLTVVGSGVIDFDASGNLVLVDDQPLYSAFNAAGVDVNDRTTWPAPPDDANPDSYGATIEPRPLAVTDANALTWNNGAVQDRQIAIDMQTSQYASPSVVVSQEQDGFGTGTLVKLSVDELGNVIGNFSNGTPRKLMRLALAKFTNPNALDKVGNNMYAQSNGSGVPVIGTVGSGVGNIFTNALELSNVDIAQEFVKMITTQRGFSANSKTITTTDEMLTEVINLKR